MNIGRACRVIPAYMPHELLGFNPQDLRGMLLTIDIVNQLIIEENEQHSSKGNQSARINKFKQNK